MTEKFKIPQIAEETNLKNATVNILIELSGEVHLVAMKSERLEAINHLIKSATEHLVKTGRTQSELLEFLGYKEGDGGD